jgi:hypothetical protein
VSVGVLYVGSAPAWSQDDTHITYGDAGAAGGAGEGGKGGTHHLLPDTPAQSGGKGEGGTEGTAAATLEVTL